MIEAHSVSRLRSSPSRLLSTLPGSTVVCRPSSVGHQLSPTTPNLSNYLKIPLPFPISHLGAEFPPLPFPSLGEMLDKGLSKQFIGNRGILHLGRGIFDIGGQTAVLVIPRSEERRVGKEC